MSSRIFDLHAPQGAERFDPDGGRGVVDCGGQGDSRDKVTHVIR